MSSADDPRWTNEDIRDYLSLDEQDLYELIPGFLPEYEGTNFMTEGQRAAGKKAFEQRVNAIKKTLCHDWQLCSRLKDPNFDDTVKLVVMVGDVIAACSGGIPPFLAASIIAKIGIRNFCNCERPSS
jgi:hypothetical protein